MDPNRRAELLAMYTHPSRPAREIRELVDAYDTQRDNALEAWILVRDLATVLGYQPDKKMAEGRIAELGKTLREENA